MRAASLPLLGLLLAVPAMASWPTLGTPLFEGTKQAHVPRVVMHPDSGHYVGFIVYAPDGVGLNFGNIFLDRFDHTGGLGAGWPFGGLLVNQHVRFDALDLSGLTNGGVLVSSRISGGNGGSSPTSAYVLSDATISEVASPLRLTDPEQSDDAGGLYQVSARALSFSPVIVDAFHADALGRLQQRTLLYNVNAHNQLPYVRTPIRDGVGGAYYFVGDTTARIYRLRPDLGDAPGWPADTPVPYPAKLLSAGLLRDSDLGVRLFWSDSSGAWMRGFDSTGVAIAPGVVPVPGPAADEPATFLLTRNGHMLLLWRRGDQLWAQMVDEDGVPLGASASGAPYCSAPGAKTIIGVVPTESGGALVAWNDLRDVGHLQIYFTRLDATGGTTAGWPADGWRVTPAPVDQSEGVAALDDTTAAFAWSEFPRDTTGAQPSTRYIFTTEIQWQGAGPPEVPPAQLYGFSANRTAPLARLAWYGAVGPAFADLARADSDGVFTVVGTVDRVEPGYYRGVTDDADVSGPRFFRLQDAAGASISDTLRLGPMLPGPPPPPSPTVLLLESTLADSSGISFVWRGAGPSTVVVTESVNGSPWSAVGSAARETGDRYRFHVGPQDPFLRLRYRLVSAGGAILSDTAYVGPTQGSPLNAILSAIPSTDARTLAVKVRLWAHPVGDLEMYDITGRRIAQQHLALSGPAEPTVVLPLPEHPGLVFLRLRQGTFVATRKFMLVR